ncbi:ferric reductase-like transmembrane domain-containing protein [Labilibaculum manganireducens]|uniref:ferric reductase-like transmembrane domain-containing protein n=1 Tax=Labilibaculum manganireducens TaxID=1940525 RepID=UPI0029F48292|nr:ferric reductase-like transmembrane domain-containing protein [Labilibaculum manganireducens]
MNWLKKNRGWILVCIIAFVPLLSLYELANFNFENNNYDFLIFDDYELSPELAEKMDVDAIPGIKYAIHTTGKWGIRFLIAILMCTPVRILFGWTSNLRTRQAIGITTGVYALLHFSFFIKYEGFLAIFSEVKLVTGFLAGIIVFALMITSNKRSMKLLKKNWKKLHKLAYVAAGLVVLHVILLEEDWLVYVGLLGLGFIIRYKPIRSRLEELRMKKANGL